MEKSCVCGKLGSEPQTGEGFSHKIPMVMHGAERIKDDGAPPFSPAKPAALADKNRFPHRRWRGRAWHGP
jgi:hypothetical protein